MKLVGLVVIAGFLAVGVADAAAPAPVWLFQRTGEIDVSSLDYRGAHEIAAGPSLESPTWAPDGSRVAYIDTRSPGGASQTADIVVANADGSDATQLTHGVWVVEYAWSHDGREMAFRDGSGAIQVVDVDDGSVRQVAAEGSGPSWSPDDRSLLFAAAGGVEVLTVADGSIRTLAPVEGPPIFARAVFSPDGQEVAYADDLHLYVVGADGTDRRLATDQPAEDVWWPSPAEIAFQSARAEDGRPVLSSYYEGVSRTNIWEVPPDGSAARRITGPSVEPHDQTFSYAAAVSSADSRQMVYVSETGAWRANADGSCARLVARPPTAFEPQWNPTVAPGSLPCVELQAIGTGPKRFSRTAPSTVVIRLSNTGTETAHGVVVRVGLVGRGRLDGCIPGCSIASIAAGASATVAVRYRPLGNGPAGLRYSFASREPNSSRAPATGEYVRSVGP